MLSRRGHEDLANFWRSPNGRPKLRRLARSRCAKTLKDLILQSFLGHDLIDFFRDFLLASSLSSFFIALDLSLVDMDIGASGRCAGGCAGGCTRGWTSTSVKIIDFGVRHALRRYLVEASIDFMA